MIETNIEKSVLLLALYKKESDESISDIILKLSDTQMFTIKEGKALLKELKNDNYLEGGVLTFKGIEEARAIEIEFKI